MNSQRGFTLLEVLIALLLVSIALAALVQVGARRADTLVQLEQRNTAYAIGHSVLTRLYQTQQQPGVLEGTHQGLQQRWYWRAEIQPTDNDRILRIDLRVHASAQADYAAAQLVGFAWL